MFFFGQKPYSLRHHIGHVIAAIGVVLVWRGIWYLLDGIDAQFLDNNHFLSSIGGIVIGLIILYLPDRDVKELI